MEKGGSQDGVISTVSKNLVNAISGNWKPDWVHVDIYAMGSKCLSKITNYISFHMFHTWYIFQKLMMI